jgi:hypothetical protein
MDALETSVAVELITEPATEPIDDLPAYIATCIDTTRDRIIGCCREARRQVARVRAA